MLSNKTYDVLKWIAQIVLPALGALYFGLSRIWGLPYGEEIVGTLALIDTFLGAVLGISTVEYKKSLKPPDEYGEFTEGSEDDERTSD